MFSQKSVGYHAGKPIESVVYCLNVSQSWYITARDQSMLESDVTEGGKNSARSCHWLPVFFFVNEHNNNLKPQAKKQRFSKLSQKRNSS